MSNWSCDKPVPSDHYGPDCEEAEAAAYARGRAEGRDEERQAMAAYLRNFVQWMRYLGVDGSCAEVATVLEDRASELAEAHAVTPTEEP